jgi:outer membrane protein assembly factor BamB
LRSATGASDFVVRAYDLHTGTLLWERREHRGAVTERAYAVAARDGLVFAAGDLVSSADGKQELALLVLNAETGLTVWESESATGSDQFGRIFGHAGAVQVKDDRVFVAGDVLSTAASGNTLLVESHDRATGALLWQHPIPDAFFFTNATAFNDLAVHDDFVYVAAWIFTDPVLHPNLPWDFVVYALDAGTGELVWTDRVHRQAGGQASRVRFGSGRLFVYGWDCDEYLTTCFSNLRTYDPQVGTLLWESRFTGLGGDSLIPTNALTVHGDQILIGTGLLDAQQDQYVWTIRSYDAERGALLWESQSPSTGFTGTANVLTVAGGRLFAAGSADRADGGFDFTVRAYAIQHDE